MKVLIVDDEIEICKRLESELKKQGCKAEYTISPVDIMARLYNAKTEGEPYELILLDLRMPKVSGFEVLKQIREAGLDLDVVIITAYGDENKAIEAIRLGAIDYLRKPISLEELTTTVFRVRRKRAERGKRALEWSILIVDDEKDLCARIKRELEKEGYHQVATAYDGVEGLNYFENNRVDIAIVDIRMPIMDGLEMLEKCREITDDFISIIITGFGDHEKAIASLRLGVFNYLRKPISLEELVSSVNKGIEMLLLRRGLSVRKRELEIETALKTQYAEKIEREKRFTENIVAAIPDSLLVLDKDLRIKSANRSFYETFQSEIDSEKVIGSSIAEILGDKDGRLSAELTELFGTEAMLENFELHYQPVCVPGTGMSEKLGGRVFNIRARGMIIAKEEALVVIRDITERKQAEEERKKLEFQLQHAQKMEAVDTLAGGIAHDFNNILMGIQGNASLMLLDVDSGHPLYEKIKNIEQSVQSGADLAKQLLGFARGGKYKVKTTNPNKLIKESSKMFGRTKKEIKIHTKYQKDIWNVEVDPDQIGQVLLNLYVNAWHAMPNGGELYLETKNVTLDEAYVKPYQIMPGRYVNISIKDTGIGMDEETRKKVFDPFFTTKEMGGGTGLGLASVYGIIKNHGGYITVYSEKGEGTTFTIYLPASEKEVIEEEKELSKEIFKGKETVLLVDDEEMIIYVGKEMLKALGYKLLLAKNGKEAIKVYNANRDDIDIVMLDMIMPEMGGGEVYDRLKEINPDIKVLLSSGYSINGQATEILERGCNGFVRKPFTLRELSQGIREILDKRTEVRGKK